MNDALEFKKVLSVIFFFSAVILSGCGGDSAEENQQETAEDDEEVRAVEHMMGETELEGSPDKVVALQDYVIDHLLSLDITPVAASNMADSEFPDFIADHLQETTNLGNVMEPNFEVIMETDPDLIIGQEYHEQSYDQLSNIAPTLLVDREELDWDWKAVFEEIGRFVDQEEAASSVLEQYEQKAEEAEEALQEAVGDETFMLLRVMENEIRVYGIPQYTVLYEDLGLTPGPNVSDEERNEPITLEALPDYDADHIFLLDDSGGIGTGDGDSLPDILDISVWEGMSAVQNDQVYVVDYDLWFQAWGPIGYEALIEDAVNLLTD